MIFYCVMSYHLFFQLRVSLARSVSSLPTSTPSDVLYVSCGCCAETIIVQFQRPSIMFCFGLCAWWSHFAFSWATKDAFFIIKIYRSFFLSLVHPLKPRTRQRRKTKNVNGKCSDNTQQKKGKQKTIVMNVKENLINFQVDEAEAFRSKRKILAQDDDGRRAPTRWKSPATSVSKSGVRLETLLHGNPADHEKASNIHDVIPQASGWEVRGRKQL